MKIDDSIVHYFNRPMLYLQALLQDVLRVSTTGDIREQSQSRLAIRSAGQAPRTGTESYPVLHPTRYLVLPMLQLRDLILT